MAMPPRPIHEALQLALQHHQAGRLAQAETLCRQILAQQPNHVDALHCLGMIAGQVGRTDIAVDLIQQTIALAPNFPEAHNNLGNALRDRGQPEKAIAAYRQAIALKPDYPEAHYNLGNVLRDHGQLDDAIAAYRRAIILKPNYPEAHGNLGLALKDKGQLDEAIAAHRQAIALKPDDHGAFSNLGIALKSKGQLDEAITAFRQAAALQPNLAEARFNLGNALSDQGQLDEAINAYRHAIALKPDDAQARFNLGNALNDKGQPDEAIAVYREAIAVKPNFPEAHNNLGNVLKDTGQLNEAIASFRRAIDLKADYAVAHSNLVYSLQFHPDHDAQSILREHRHWNRNFAEPLQKILRSHANDRSPTRRLRVGYVSPHFRDHCQSFFTVPLLSHHDHHHFEIFCYADVNGPDTLTDRLRGYADVWRNSSACSDAQMDELIRNDRIDILVDLTMHMTGSRLRLFARKPAPVQLSWLAYPGTTGLDAINYRLTDPYLDPPGACDADYSEESIRLPDSFWCYDPLTESPPVNPLPALASGRFTFGSLNNYCKVHEAVIELWSKVLSAVTDSRLLLLGKQGAHRQRALELFNRFGVAGDRIEWFTPAPRPEYLAAYHRIDLCLDTFPYNGHTTSLDSFWMGVPVVTLTGQTVVSRGGWCQLSNLGLTELAGQTPEQFVKIAVDLAYDLPRLQTLRSTLRRRMEQSPLMDAPRFARNIEAAYRAMWRTWCATGS